MSYDELIRRRIKELLGAKGLSVNKLADMSGVRQSTVDQLVRGSTTNPKIKTLHRIITAGFQMTVGEFFSTEEFDNAVADDECSDDPDEED
jgi:transcriptional regulator with XRE-family HTH domain